MKTVFVRPKLNRFIKNKRIYLRNEVTAAFVVKKSFSDDGEEALAFVRCGKDSTVTSLHDDIMEQILFCRSDKPDNSTASMDALRKLPRPIFGALMWTLHKLDNHGWVPLSLIKTDPYYASVVISNLGSIGLKCGYHHLCNWGTNSLFCVMGQTKNEPVFSPDGSVEFRPTLELSLTIDERLADGYYYSRSVKLLKHLLTNPELLELPAEEKIEF
ncbi:MAG: 2-oxo acid dehydrogenase subunit E2 [Oscillospiraceae bacterium]|nr:2-oxo acid dehydrogenase subunit E2 [Oscillospiraceae bacterium]